MTSCDVMSLSCLSSLLLLNSLSVQIVRIDNTSFTRSQCNLIEYFFVHICFLFLPAHLINPSCLCLLRYLFPSLLLSPLPLLLFFYLLFTPLPLLHTLSSHTHPPTHKLPHETLLLPRPRHRSLARSARICRGEAAARAPHHRRLLP